MPVFGGALEQPSRKVVPPKLDLVAVTIFDEGLELRGLARLILYQPVLDDTTEMQP